MTKYLVVRFDDDPPEWVYEESVYASVYDGSFEGVIVAWFEKNPLEADL